MRFLYITPYHLHWRARKKLSVLESIKNDICRISGRNIDFILDTDTFAVIDFDANRFICSCPVTENLYSAICCLQNVKEFWYYHKNIDAVFHKPSLYNLYQHLKTKLYG